MRRVMAMGMALVLVLGGQAPAAAQWDRAAVGAGVGFVGGTVITTSIVVARARFLDEYVASVDDMIHWQSAPILLTPAVGTIFGLAGRKTLEQSVIGSTAGLALGTGVGAGIGWLLSGTPESPWAGAVIGAGAGMTIGGLLLGIRAWAREGEEGEELESALRVLLFRLPV